MRSPKQEIGNGYAKSGKRVTICHEPNYTEPVCPNNGFYNVSSDKCGILCSNYEDCEEALGEGYYCLFNTTSVGGDCATPPTGVCTARNVVT